MCLDSLACKPARSHVVVRWNGAPTVWLLWLANKTARQFVVKCFVWQIGSEKQGILLYRFFVWQIGVCIATCQCHAKTLRRFLLNVRCTRQVLIRWGTYEWGFQSARPLCANLGLLEHYIWLDIQGCAKSEISTDFENSTATFLICFDLVPHSEQISADCAVLAVRKFWSQVFLDDHDVLVFFVSFIWFI